MTDTAAKRLRAIDFGVPLSPGMPFPDASVDDDDRAHLLWLYAAGEPFEPVRVPRYGMINTRGRITGALNVRGRITGTLVRRR